MAAIGSRTEIEAFRQGAVDGVFTMERETAQRCADQVAGFIERLRGFADQARDRAFILPATLESEKQMYRGFDDKMRQAGELVGEFIEAADRLRESFLIAGKILIEQDASFGRDLTGSGDSLEGGGR